jgi:[ribosomal protein S5]-alanine N-acetyltransferase
MIETTNLQLLPVERIHIKAFLSSKSELAELLQVTVPNNWPQFPHRKRAGSPGL